MILCIAMPFGIWLLRNFPHPRLICLVGGLLLAGFVFISSFLKNFGAFVAIYAILVGIIVGFLYYIPIMICQRFFEKNRAFIGGLLVGAFGLGALIYGLIFFAIVNPNNLEPNKHEDKNSYFSNHNGVDVSEVANNVPIAFRTLSLIYVI